MKIIEKEKRKKWVLERERRRVGQKTKGHLKSWSYKVKEKNRDEKRKECRVRDRLGLKTELKGATTKMNNGDYLRKVLYRDGEDRESKVRENTMAQACVWERAREWVRERERERERERTRESKTSRRKKTEKFKSDIMSNVACNLSSKEAKSSHRIPSQLFLRVS